MTAERNYELTRLLAQMDQAKAGLREVAIALWFFYTDLVEVGFSPEQALQISMGWLIEMIRIGAAE